MFRAARRDDVPWSGAVLLGGALLGWGLFNLIEGLVDHHLLQLHHVMDSAANHWPADLAFLASGVLLAVAGLALIQRGRA
jgi:uncharacterized membrane protein